MGVSFLLTCQDSVLKQPFLYSIIVGKGFSMLAFFSLEEERGSYSVNIPLQSLYNSNRLR
jgi:hypothetical protein